MAEFWESAFQQKQEMWWWEPADSAVTASELFREYGLNKILIPGFGYGRNAQIFLDNGCAIAGIEISETAIDLARKHFWESITVYHGSVGLMPFDQEIYDGIFSYSLLHLLNPAERTKLIKDCYTQLRLGGYMVFISISPEDFRYGQGEVVSRNTFEMPYGVTLFFYDSATITSDFSNYGLISAELISEPIKDVDNKPKQRFWYVICRKEIN